MRLSAALLVAGLGLALAQPSDNNGGNNGQYNFGSGNGNTNGNLNTGGGGNGNANGNVNAGDGNGNINGNANNGAGNGVFNGNYNFGSGNGVTNGNNNAGNNNGGLNGNSNTGNSNGVFNGNSNSGDNNGNKNGNFNFGSGNGVSNGNNNVGSNNGNGNGNNNGNSNGKGDPVFTDFVGRSFEFLGEPGRFYSVLSEKFHMLSTLMKFGQMWDHNGTYMEGYGFQYRSQKVVVAITRDDELLVSVNGKPLVMSSGEIQMQHVIDAGLGHTMTVDWQRNRPGLGNTVEISTEMLKLTAWLTEAGTRDAGGLLQPSYLNFDLTLTSDPANDVMAGIVGETYERLVAGAEEVRDVKHALYLPEDSTFRGHALSQDYEQQGYFDSAHRFNLYGAGPELRARRLAESSSRVAFPATAAGRNLPNQDELAAPVKLTLNRRLLRA